jgi:tetratricopeptide (TPR) repeat protein
MWSPSFNNRAAACAALLVAALAGCHSTPPQAQRAPAPVPVSAPVTTKGAAPASPAPSAAGAKGAANAAQGATAAAAGATPASAAAVRPEVPPAANADFTRAVGYMRAGNATEAELGFKQIALQYPQFAAPLVNLGLLYRKAGRLEDSEQALKSAVDHQSDDAAAWSELGVTQRMRGEFKDAAASYEQAIKADPQFAPAWRNLGVVSDLYLGDPQRALTALTRYQELTGEEKPVSGWIAELRQRLGLPPLKKPAAAPQPAAAPADTAPGAAPAAAPPAPAAKSGAGG